MLLTIDVGNTNLCFGVYEGETLKGSFRLSTDPGRTADELGLLLCGYFQRFSLPLDKVEDVIISSVVPQVMGPLEGAVSAYLGRRALVVDRDVDPGLKMAVEGKERLGSDRSVACVAAVRKYGGPCLLLDFGTATTLDAINEEGAYLGGCIAPGLGLSMNALTQGAALLPQVELACPGKVLDCTTVGQIQAGVVLGYVGAMEYLIRRAREEMGNKKRGRTLKSGPFVLSAVLSGGLTCGSPSGSRRCTEESRPKQPTLPGHHTPSKERLPSPDP